MEYQVSINIHKPAHMCYEHYTESKHIKKWLPQLKDIVDTKGELFTLGSQGYFIFHQKGHEMIMEIEVTQIEKPWDITMVYKVPGAFNQCKNHFINHDKHTLWIMDVIFEFEEDPNLSIELFKQSTLKSMEIFKAYMEGLN